MNERIRELAEQAGIDVDDSLAIEPEPTYYSTQSDFKKFAELIVRECSRIADGWVDNDDDGKNYPSEMIKQHFGVER